MPIDIGEILATLTLKDKFSSEFEKAASKLEKSGKKMESIGRDLSDIGTQLTKTITLPILAIGGASLKLASDFESSFAGVRKTVNATSAEFAALSQGMRELSKTIPVNVNELNKIGESAGQLGIRTENILSFTRVIADLGATTNLSSDEAATSLARLANITQLSQDQFDRLGSTIVALGNNFATTEREIVEIGLRIAGAGTQIGLTEGQILAVGTALSSVGINAEAGGSAISKVMINMALAVSRGGRELKQFADIAGQSSADFAAGFKNDAAGALNEFIVGLGRLQESGGDVLKVLDEMGVTEVRMRDALLRAAGAGDLLTRALDLQAVAWEENTALAKEAAQRYGTFESQLTITINKLKDVGITLGTALLPVISSMLDLMTPLIGVLESAAKTFADLPKPVQTITVLFFGLLAAIGPVVFVTGQLITSWGVIASKAPALVLALNTVRLAFLGIAAAIGTILLVALDAAIRKFGEAQEAAMRYEREASKALDITFRLNRARIKGDGIISPELFEEARQHVIKLAKDIDRLEKEIAETPKHLRRGDRYEKLNKELGGLRDRYNLIYKELDKVKGQSEEVEDVTVDLTQSFSLSEEALQKLISAYQELESILDPLSQALEDSANEWEALQDASNAEDLERISKAIALGLNPNLEEAAKKINEFAEAHGIAFRTSAEQLQKYVDHNIAVEKSIQANTEALEDYINAAGQARNIGPEIIEGINTTTADDFPFLDDLLSEIEDIDIGAIFVDDLEKEFEEFSKSGWQRIWDDIQAVTDRAWENIQDSASNFISNTIREQELSWKSLTDSMIDIFSNMLSELLIKWAVYLAKKVAANLAADAAISASNASAQVLGGGGGVGGIGFDFTSLGGGGGGGTSAAGGASWSTIAAAGAVVAIVGAVGYSLGWWGGKASKKGIGTFGSDEFGNITFDAVGDRAKDIADKFKEAAKILTESISDMGLEVVKLRDVTLQKVGKNYNIGGASLSVLGIENTAQAISEAVAVLALRGAEFGDSVSSWVQAIIHGSEAVTMAAFEADVEFARMVENFGKSDLSQKVAAIGRDMSAIFDRVVQLIGDNIQELSFGLTQTINEEIARWSETRRSITGEQQSPKEQLQLLQAQGEIWNAEKALRIASLQAQVIALEAERELEKGRINLLSAGIGGRGKLLDVEVSLTRAFFSAQSTVLSTALTALDIQINAINKLIDALLALPDIDISKIKLPRVDLGKGIDLGGDVLDKAAEDLKRLDQILKDAELQFLSPFEQSLARINQKWDEAAKLAGDNADKLAEVNAMRQREIDAMEEQLRLDFLSDLDAFAEGVEGPLSGLGREIFGIKSSAADLIKQLAELADELGLSAHAVLRYYERIRDAEEAFINQAAQQGLAALFSGLASLIHDEQLRYELLKNAAIIEFELKMALYKADYEILKGLGKLSAETIALLDKAFKWIDKNKKDILDIQVPKPKPKSKWDDGENVFEKKQRELIEATNRLKDILSRSLSPFEQAIRSVVDEFADLRKTLGWTSDLQRVYAIELQRVVDAQLESIRKLRESLDFRQDSPLRTIDQFDAAYKRLLDAADAFAGGDLSQIDKIPELAQLVLDLIPSSGASSARRNIFDFIRNLLLDIEDVTLDLVDDIEPGDVDDPFKWLREQPTAGDISIVNALYDVRQAIRNIETKSFSYSPDSTNNSTRSTSSSSVVGDIESRAYLRRIADNTSDTVSILKGTGIRSTT